MYGQSYPVLRRVRTCTAWAPATILNPNLPPLPPGGVKRMRQPPSGQLPATAPPLPHSDTMLGGTGASSEVSTCLGSAAPTIATTSLDPAASHMLAQYPACVSVRSWSTLVFERRGGGGCFHFFCQPSTSFSSTSTCAWPVQQVPCRKQQGGKHEANAQRREWVKKGGLLRLNSGNKLHPCPSEHICSNSNSSPQYQIKITIQMKRYNRLLCKSRRGSRPTYLHVRVSCCWRDVLHRWLYSA